LKEESEPDPQAVNPKRTPSPFHHANNADGSSGTANQFKHTDHTMNDAPLRAAERLPSDAPPPRPSLMAFHKISTTECTDSAFLEFRNKFFSEAYMYGRHVYPSFIVLVKSVRVMFESFKTIEYEVDKYLDLLPSFVQDCRKTVDAATNLSLQHSFVRSNLQSLEFDVERQRTVIRNQAQVSRTSAAATGSGLVPVLALASAGPIALVGAGLWRLGSKLFSQSSQASQQQLTAISLKNLTDAIREQCEVVESRGNILDEIASWLYGVASAPDNYTEQLAWIYFKTIRVTSDKLLPTVETVLSHRTDYETTTLRLGHDRVNHQFELEWTDKWESIVND
jgi:hypothetical protein